MENSFWSNHNAWRFVDCFKKSFALYIKSGIRTRTQVALDILKNERGRGPVTEDFKTKLFKIVMDHRLRKFHFFYLRSILLTRGHEARPENQVAGWSIKTLPIVVFKESSMSLHSTRPVDTEAHLPVSCQTTEDWGLFFRVVRSCDSWDSLWP
jgi:hypothetical protein